MTDGGARYAVFVEQELKAERDRRVILDGRGQTVVNTSGTFVTLLAAVGALVVVNKRDYELPSGAHYCVIGVVTMFTIALFFAILATYHFSYEVAKRARLREMPRGHWGDSEDVAVRNIMAVNVETVVTLRNGNNKKANLLIIALASQLLALGTLGATVYFMIIGR